MTHFTKSHNENFKEVKSGSLRGDRIRLLRRSGRAIAQAVGLWLSTAEAQVRARSGHVGFVVDKVALGQVLSEYFGFPCQASFPQILHLHNHPG
jgi:hypothetical protein